MYANGEAEPCSARVICMSIKFKYQSKEQIPAGQESLYIERDGAFLLDAEGVVEKSKLDKFRTNNVALLKQIDDLKGKYHGIDPDYARQLEQAKRELEEQAALKAGEVDKVVASRVQSIKSDLERTTAERDSLNARLADIQINQGVIVAATKRGLRPTAIADVTLRAQRAFKLVNGVPQAQDGDRIRYGKDGVTPMTLDEWIDSLVTEAPHLFEPSVGGVKGSGRE
jgi:vacuolar-type H+-ATPase subunit I/STV1